MEQEPRLNLFALPSQTTLVFGGILLVIGLPLLMNLTGRFAVLLPLLPVVVLLFTLWDFLAEPVRELRRYKAKPVDGEDGVWLTQQVAAIAEQVGLQPPLLVKTCRPLRVPRAFGSWRQRYLIFPDQLTSKMRHMGDYEPEKAQYAAVILHHELAHFANHDVALYGFARSLLRQTVFVCLAYWAALFWTPILYQVGARYLPVFLADVPPELQAQLLTPLSPDKQAQMLEIMRNPPLLTWDMMATMWLELSMAVLPLVGGAIFLWVRDLNLLLRIRELYADARAERWLGPSLSSIIAPALFSVKLGSTDPTPPADTAQSVPRGRWPTRLSQRARAFAKPTSIALGFLHPDAQPKESRRGVLLKPQIVYGTVTAIGRRAGVIVLLLFMIMGSLLAPAQRGIGSEIGIGVGFLVLATGLTPSGIAHLPDLRTIRSDRRCAIGVYMLVFNSALLVALAIATIGVLLRPDDLNLTMYAIAGVLPDRVQPIIGDPVGYMVQAVLGTLLVYFIAAPLLLYGFLALDFRLKQRVLHWYAAPWLAQRSAQVLLLISVALTVVLWFGVAPLLHMLAFPLIIGLDWQGDWGMVAGLLSASLSLGALGYWLRWGDRRYRNRCPQCGGDVEVSFHLGVMCPHCGESLQPWLTVKG